MIAYISGHHRLESLQGRLDLNFSSLFYLTSLDCGSVFLRSL